jgi:hypothetical protein
VGRAVGIAVAVLAGIISLPALLGSDRPPPVPADVGLAPPPAEPVPGEVPAATPAAMPRPPKQVKGGRRRLTGRNPRLDRPDSSASHRRKRSHPRHGPHRDAPEAAVPPSTSAYTPPVYSYIPPAARPEFGFER